jgi:hypothetical protein
MTDRSEQSNDEPRREAAGLDFLDFLFTVSMGIGLTPEILQQTQIKGLLQAQWALGTGRYPNNEEWIQIFSFFLGFLTLTLSWYGYHGSLDKRPHRYDKGTDMFRFVLDVVLVILYGIMMVRFWNLDVVLAVLLVVFIIYSIWDSIKFFTPNFFEEGNEVENTELKRRIRVTWKWTIFVFLAFLSHLVFNLEWISVLVAIASVILYRLNKYMRFRDVFQRVTRWIKIMFSGKRQPASD